MKGIDDWHSKNGMHTAIIERKESVTYQELEQRVQVLQDMLTKFKAPLVLTDIHSSSVVSRANS